MKNFKRILGLCLAFAMIIAAFAAAAPATETSAKSTNSADTYRKVSFADKMKTYEKVYEVGNSTVAYSVTYPYITIEGDKEATTAARKAIKKYAVSTLIKPYTKEANLFGGDAEYVVEAEFGDSLTSRCGNILSISYHTYVNVENSSHPTNEAGVLNIDLTTGKVTKLSKLFNTKKFISAVAKEIYARKTSAELYEGEGLLLYEDVTAADIAKKIKSGNVEFTENGVYIIIDEMDGISAHATGMLFCLILPETYEKYIKKEAEHLFNPTGSYKLVLEYSAGTGYLWSSEVVSGSDCVEIVEKLTVADYDDSQPLSGGPMKDIVIVNVVKAGDAVIKSTLARPWESADSSATVEETKLTVSKKLVISEK